MPRLPSGKELVKECLLYSPRPRCVAERRQCKVQPKKRNTAAAAAWMFKKKREWSGEEGPPLKKVYGTFRNDLGRMRGWLKLLKVTDIAMESTGVYWRPIWNVLEGHGFHLVLANPQQVKALHGRKSDKRDSQRIAEFLQDRRIDPSFVPPPEIRRLRDLLRYRVSLLEQQNETHNKIRDLFETANIKWSSVASDLLGVTGQRIIEALIAGETSPDKLSWKVKGRLRKREKEVRQSLVGC